MSKSRTQNRRGIALVLSLIAIAVVGALITALWSSTAIEVRSDENTRRLNQSMAAAEAAAGEVIGTWNSGVWNMMSVGEVTPISGNSPAGTGVWTGSVRRVNNEFFLLDLTAKDRNSSARQRVGLLVKLRELTFDINAALTTRGNGKIGGSTQIHGEDTRPWNDCPPAGAGVAGVRHPNPSQINYVGGCNGASCITGNPNVQTDATVNDNTFFSYGDADWAALQSSATLVIAGGSGSITQIQPSATSGVCNRADLKNWGEPTRPPLVPSCTTYYPIIYINGDAHITGDRGEGILMVNGDLELIGGFVFDGIAVVRGSLKSAGTGGHITGGVLAANIDLELESILGNAVLDYSSCAVSRAKNASAPGAQLRSRGWFPLY
jgi:hypothetical protein